MEAKFGQQFEEASLLSEEASKDLGECSMKSNSSSFSNHRDDGSKQFSMSDHRLSHGSVEDVISGKTQVTQLNIVAGYTHVTDSCSSLENVKCDNPINIQTDDLVHSVSSVGLVNNIELGKKTLHASSTDNTKIYEADLNTNQKNFSTKLKHHSRSSSSHSTSSGDLTYPNVTYVCAYDINLRTQPSNVPPPFRAPPKVFSKKETTEMNMYRRSTGDQEVNILKPTLSHQIHYRVGASKSGRFLGVAKDTYSSFFDVNEDANSAAATMKEAMEQAQAKLESAKELMERERDNLQGRKKLGQKEATKYNEMEIKASEKGNIFHDEITKKPLLKEGKRMKKHALHDTKNVMTTEKKERDVGTTEESQQMKQGYGFKSFQMPYKSEEVSAEWKTEKEFYELVNNEKKFRVVKEAFTHKDAEKKPKTTAEFDVDKHEINEVVASGDNNSIAGNINNSIAGNMTWMEDISEIPNSVLETCSLKENVNKLEEVHSCNHQKESEKVQAEQEALFNEQKLKKQNLSEKVSLCGVSEKNGEFFTDAFKLEEIYHNDEENGNSQVAEEACTHAVEVKKLSGTNLTSLYESEKKLNINMQDNCQSRNEEIECKLDGTSSVSVQKESKKLDGACMQVDIDLESKLVQDGNEVIENSEIRKQMKPIKETQPDYNEMLEAPLELLQNKNKVNANQMLYQQENTLKTRVMGGNHVESEDIQSEEVHEALCTSQNFISDVHKTEKMESEWTIERETEHEKETTRKSEEEREREREREKDRGVVERAAREVHERAVFEARERVERIAVEKALKEVKLKAERAAVERSLAEARERAVKKALDEIAAADARKRAEKLNAISREKGRKENESRDILRAFDVEDTKMKLKAGSSDALHDERFLNVGSSSNSQRHADSYAHGEVESPLRCKARLERHQRTIERAAKALAEKNMRDDLAQREQAERNRLAESLDADVRRWSTGKEGNLRALLSTLQYILGPESGWQPIPLTDVITAAAAKKAYKKATLCVHPDKLQQRGANIQQKYICEKVFDLLKDAWNEFNSKER